MYKKSSSFVNGRPLYGWSTNGRTKPNNFDSINDPHFNGRINSKIYHSKKNGLYWLSDEERQKLIEEYLENENERKPS